MPLDPAWYNALVDDTGTGTTGTVWNKAAIAGLLTNINNEIARLDAAQNFWTPTVRSANGGTPAYTLQTGFYIRTGKLCWIGFKLAFTKGSLGAGGAISITVPFPIVASGAPFGGITIPWFLGLSNPIASLGTISTSGGDSMTLVFVPPAGGTAIQYFATENFGAGAIELIGQGSYAIA